MYKLNVVERAESDRGFLVKLQGEYWFQIRDQLETYRELNLTQTRQYQNLLALGGEIRFWLYVHTPSTSIWA